MRSTLSSGIADQLTLPRSIGFRRWPSSRIRVLLPAVSPKPRMSICRVDAEAAVQGAHDRRRRST
jgi:hypothetical protein